MDINIIWHQPIELRDGLKDNLIYSAGDLTKLRDIPGIYMFCRLYDNVLYPLYIGKALNLSTRIQQQLDRTSLMVSIKKSHTGRKVLVLGEFKGRPGQIPETCIRLVEKALINHALAEGNKIINKQGTRTPYNAITFKGYFLAKSFTGKQMFVKKAMSK
jgi:hypothetical protein